MALWQAIGTQTSFVSCSIPGCTYFFPRDEPYFHIYGWEEGDCHVPSWHYYPECNSIIRALVGCGCSPIGWHESSFPLQYNFSHQYLSSNIHGSGSPWFVASFIILDWQPRFVFVRESWLNLGTLLIYRGRFNLTRAFLEIGTKLRIASKFPDYLLAPPHASRQAYA